MVRGPNKGTLTEVDTTSVEYVRESSAVHNPAVNKKWNPVKNKKWDPINNLINNKKNNKKRQDKVAETQILGDMYAKGEIAALPRSKAE